MSAKPIPTRVAELSATAQSHAVARDFERAAACYQQALALSPGDPDLLLQLSYMESLAGHYRAAHAYALQAGAAPTQRQAVVKELLARQRTFN